MLGTKTMSQKSFGWCGVCSCACHGALISSCSLTLSLHLLTWRLSQICHRGWHPLLTLHSRYYLWRCRHDFSDCAFPPHLLLFPQHDLVRCEFEAPNYCVWPLRCVLTCHIMSHLRRCISNIRSITGRQRGIKDSSPLGYPGHSAVLLRVTHTLQVAGFCCHAYKWLPRLGARAAVCQPGPLRLFLRHFIKPAGQGPGCRR